MVRVFNPPPGWPKPEEGWVPPPGWKPNPEWPEPPQGWDFWIEKADDVGSSLFGGSALGSSLFESSESSTESYGSVSPSGAAHIPGAASGPDFNVSNRPESASDGVSQSSASAPTSPSGGYSSAGAGQRSGPGGPSGVRAGPTSGSGDSSTSPYATSSTPGRSPNAPPPVGPQGGGRTILVGLALVIGGIVFSAISFYNAPVGGEYSLYWTPMLFGVIIMIMGVVRAVRSRVKKQRLSGTGMVSDPSSHLTQPGGGTDASEGPQTGYTGTVSMHNPNDPKNYKR